MGASLTLNQRGAGFLAGTVTEATEVTELTGDQQDLLDCRSCAASVYGIEIR